MGLNLQVLGMQSIPRLADKLEVPVEFPTHVFSKTIRMEDFQKYLKECGKILSEFFEEYSISWWDVYNLSDVGLERMAITQEIQLDEMIQCWMLVAAEDISRLQLPNSVNLLQV